MIPSVTIVIITADRPQCVLDCAASLAPVVPGNVELLVVDSGIESPIEEKALQERLKNSRVIRCDRKNVPFQRNEGIREAYGEIVVFLDDDCLVQPGWWPAIVAPFADDGVAGVGGGIWCSLTPRLTSKRGGYVNALGIPIQLTSRDSSAPREVDWAVGANMAFRKDAVLNVGGFAEVYGIYDEDIDICLRIRARGERIVFVPDAVVYHYFAKMPRKPPTKHSEFHAGRNRSMLLVRNYGLSLRLIMFLLTAPWMRVAQATNKAFRFVFTIYGHAAAYVAGMIKGLVVGLKNPVGK